MPTEMYFGTTFLFVLLFTLFRESTKEKNAQGMLNKDEEEDESSGDEEMDSGEEMDSDEEQDEETHMYVHPSIYLSPILTTCSEPKKRKQTCTNNVVSETPALQLQGQLFNVTVEEKDSALVLDAEMPMLNLETLVMAVDDAHRILTISGEKVSPSRKRARIEKTANVCSHSAELAVLT
jgi:hypothetical protein